MDKREALKIIGMIVEGLNPYKGNFSPESIPENNPATIRALCTAIASLLTKKDRNELASEYKQKDLAELIESLNGPLKRYFEVKEKEKILIALDEGKYNTKKAAEILGFLIFELDKKIKDYGLSPFVIAKKYIYEQIEIRLDQFLEKIEKKIISEALIRSNYDIISAARLVGIQTHDLNFKIEKYNLKDARGIRITSYLENFEMQNLNKFIEEIEKQAIKETLKLKNSSLKRTSYFLGIETSSLINRIERLEIMSS